MLIKFSVENYLSFRTKAVLDLTAEALKEKRGHLHVPYLYNSKLLLLKSIVIYGHNSHGKTNFIKSYSFFQDLILGSFSYGKENNKLDEFEPFLNTSTENKPGEFEATFVLKHTKYRYGFEILKNKVVSEWLFYYDSGIRENILFRRYEQEFRDVSKTWNKDSDGRVEQAKLFTKPNHLFLSVLISQDDIPRIDSIGIWLKGNAILQGSYATSTNIAAKIYSQIKYRNTILKFLKAANLGFDTVFDKVTGAIEKGLHSDLANVWFDTEKSDFTLYTRHNVLDESHQFQRVEEFELYKRESSGSIKYFILSCFLTYAIFNGQLIWIDELDSSLHTTLLTQLLKVFNDAKNNVGGSQLIFTTHNTVMLNRQMRRDQILLVERNKFGESHIQKMHTSDTPIRIDKSVEQEYRDGKFDKKNLDKPDIEGYQIEMFNDK